MDVAAALVADKYEDAKREDANRILVLKLRFLMRKLDSLLDQVPMQAKVLFHCVDGQAAYTLNLLSIPVVYRPELVDARGHVRVHPHHS